MKRMNFFIKNWKKILPGFGFFLLLYLFWRFDIKEIIIAFSQANPRYFILLPLTFSLILLIQTWKWKLILHAQNINGIGFLPLFRIQLIGSYYSMWTPGKTGVFLKAPYLKDRIGKSLEECSSGIFIDKILDLTVLFIFSVAGALILLGQFPSLLLETILVLIVFCFAIFIFYSKKRTKFLLKHFLYLFIPQKLKEKCKNSFHLFYKETPNLGKLAPSFLLTALCWLLILSQTFIIAKSLSIDINYFVFIPVAALATMAGFLPITMSGLGTREAAFVVLFKNFNILPQKLIAMSLLSVIAAYILLFLIAVFFLKISSIRKTKFNEVY